MGIVIWSVCLEWERGYFLLLYGRQLTTVVVRHSVGGRMVGSQSGGRVVRFWRWEERRSVLVVTIAASPYLGVSVNGSGLITCRSTIWYSGLWWSFLLSLLSDLALWSGGNGPL